MSDSSPTDLPYELVEHRFDGYWGALWSGRDGDDRVLVRVVSSEDLSEDERGELAKAVENAATREGELLLPLRAFSEGQSKCAVVSEYVDGVSLAAVMRAAQQGEIDLTVTLALGIARDLLDAVAELNSEDVGGLGPQSFMVCADGHTRMLEPGLAPLLRRCKAFTQRPERLGYDAPEAFQVGVELDGSVDVFSLGVVLWELMTHERLFKGTNTFKIITQLRASAVPRADESAHDEADPVPPEVADVIQRATEREAEDRYASVAELSQALAAASHTVAGAGAVAELVRELLPGELERLREADELSARIAAKTEEARRASERPPPQPARKRGPVRPPGPYVSVPVKRMSDPRLRTFLWLAVALAAVVGIYKLAMQNQLTEEAHYIMQAVRPPQPTAAPVASGLASASAAPVVRRGPLPQPSASAALDDPYAEVEAELATSKPAASNAPAAPFAPASVTPTGP